MSRLIFCFIIFFLTVHLAYSLSPDSANRFISFHLNKRVMNAVDRNGSPFSDCKIYSFATVVQKRIFSYRSIHLNAFAGLTLQVMHVGKINPIKNYSDISEDVNARSIMSGFNSGISLEKNIIKIRSSRISFSAGLWSNGVFANTVKTKTIIHERNDIFGKDSVVIDFKRNTNFYLNPFYQLTLKSKYKNTTIISGIKLLIQPFNGVDTNIEYRFFVTKLANSTGSPSHFVDNSPQIVLFFGIAI
jgi:hypothetical protein